MSQEVQPPQQANRFRRMLRRRWILKGGVAALVLAGLVVWLRPGGEPVSTGTTFAARRGPLDITVLEGGTVEARESQTIKSRIRGETKILSLVEEGYMVTPEDVANKKVLVTLDNSKLIEEKTQHDIEYESALANYTESLAQYEIQLKENENEIKAAELQLKFAMMDFQKYVGDKLANEIVDELGLRVDIAQMAREVEQSMKIVPGEIAPEGSAATNRNEAEAVEGGDLPADAEEAALSPSEKATSETPDRPMASIQMALSTRPARREEINFNQYATQSGLLEKLGDGQAQQLLRKAMSEQLIAQEELGLARTKLNGTKRLAERNFVTQQDLDNDEMSVKKSEIAVESSQTALDLFIKYEFPKEAERLLSEYEVAVNKLERTMKQAIAKAAQAEAKLKSAQASFALRAARRKDIEEQLEACTIRAERPGLVVYAGSDEPWRNREQIQEGATVYERQEIITIPDMTQMAVKVRIHEAAIKQIRVGQKARIRLESYRDNELEGAVYRLSVLPDSTSRWMNPDIKLFPVYVSIDGSHEWIKPNMSAQVEIFVKHLDDVIYVPIQAVTSSGGQRVCYVVDKLGRRERRVVETGDFNNEFIEIKSGLKEGELVLLRAPESEQLRETAGGRRPQGAQPENRQPAEPAGGQGGGPRRGGNGQRPPRAG